ncbi:hypothetical protein VIGAN_05248200 [Vigna angularis var. angularis]|uniref:Uncharacterized protein n=1 Tax=Vigna angularis var. angularis TaxID=157739 RepID=A0A0S3S7N1_PHAAN|nr:hypothetical protein VIGAN_05248200 [Vigna angularis var. angularis]
MDHLIPKGAILVGKKIDEEILSHLERRVMDWQFAHLESGCADDAREVEAERLPEERREVEVER